MARAQASLVTLCFPRSPGRQTRAVIAWVVRLAQGEVWVVTILTPRLSQQFKD